MSLNAQNEILQIMAVKVLHGIASDIAESVYYSIMTDESNIEQLVICLCWVDKEMTVCEECIGLLPVAQTNADTIIVCFNDVLLHMNLRIEDVQGQCCDGCSTWNQKWVAAKIKKLNNKCVLKHCYTV